MVDVGTGFYVEKVDSKPLHMVKGYVDRNLQSTADAVSFYNEKVDELGANLKSLESIVQGKSNNLRVIEDSELLQVRSV